MTKHTPTLIVGSTLVYAFSMVAAGMFDKSILLVSVIALLFDAALILSCMDEISPRKLGNFISGLMFSAAIGFAYVAWLSEATTPALIFAVVFSIASFSFARESGPNMTRRQFYDFLEVAKDENFDLKCIKETFPAEVKNYYKPNLLDYEEENTISTSRRIRIKPAPSDYTLHTT